MIPERLVPGAVGRLIPRPPAKFQFSFLAKRYFKAIFNLFQGLISLNLTVYPRLYVKFKRVVTQKLKPQRDD